jgi:hypothetical protein
MIRAKLLAGEMSAQSKNQTRLINDRFKPPSSEPPNWPSLEIRFHLLRHIPQCGAVISQKNSLIAPRGARQRHAALRDPHLRQLLRDEKHENFQSPGQRESRLCGTSP